jgi:hypothetical protein
MKTLSIVVAALIVTLTPPAEAGVKNVVELPGSHVRLLLRPKEVAAVIEKAAETAK